MRERRRGAEFREYVIDAGEKASAPVGGLRVHRAGISCWW